MSGRTACLAIGLAWLILVTVLPKEILEPLVHAVGIVHPSCPLVGLEVLGSTEGSVSMTRNRLPHGGDDEKSAQVEAPSSPFD